MKKNLVEFQHDLKSIVGLLDTSVRKVGVLPQCSSDGTRTLGWTSIPPEYQQLDDDGYYNFYNFEIISSNVNFEDEAKYESLDSELVLKFDPTIVFDAHDIHELSIKDSSLSDDLSRANFVSRSILGFTASQLIGNLDFAIDSLKRRGVFKTKAVKYVTCVITRYRLGSRDYNAGYKSYRSFSVKKSYTVFNLYFDKHQNVVNSVVYTDLDDYIYDSKLDILIEEAARLWKDDESDISESFVYEGVKTSSDLDR